MIAGVGTDICTLARIEAVLEQHGERFVGRLLSPYEITEAGDRIDTGLLARRWAVKEAVAKAFGCGIGEELGFHDIVISHAENGSMFVLVAKKKGMKVWATVADELGTACAFALVEKV